MFLNFFWANGAITNLRIARDSLTTKTKPMVQKPTGNVLIDKDLDVMPDLVL